MQTEHNFKKYFGQNFLKSSKYTELICSYLDLKDTDTVLEIGPGEGALTEKLLASGANVVAVEIDSELIPVLKEKFKNYSNFRLIQGDILDEGINLGLTGDFKVTGSLPYNISRKIIKKFLEFNFNVNSRNVINLPAGRQGHVPTKLVFIVQDEVADKYTALPPKANIYSNNALVFADVEKHKRIPAEEFFPVPKVDGAILEFKVLQDPIIGRDLIPEFQKLLKIGFISPRKKLKKNLKNSNKYDSIKIEEAFSEVNLDENMRAAELEFDEWVKLFGLIAQ